MQSRTIVPNCSCDCIHVFMFIRLRSRDFSGANSGREQLGQLFYSDLRTNYLQSELDGEVGEIYFFEFYTAG